MKPLLLQLQSKFTTYDVRNILGLPSTYSIRMYELLKQYERIGKRTFNLLELKELVGAIEEYREGRKLLYKDHYPLYGNFRQKVLLKAQRDLKKYTDISFTFEPIKKGRKVDQIQFHIHKNHPTRNKPKDIEQPQIDLQPVDASQIFEKIKDTVSQWTNYPDVDLIQSLLDDGKNKHHIRQAVEYVNNRIITGKAVDKPVGYFVKIINEISKQGDLFDPVQAKKDLKAKKKKELLKRQEKRKKLEEKGKKLAQDIFNKETEIGQMLVNEDSKEVRDIFVKMKTEKLSGYEP